MKYIATLVLITVFINACTFTNRDKKENELKLWYNQPAKVWEEALPLGNGHIGAMVWGNPVSERIDLNDDTFWAGGPYNNNNPDHLKHFREIQKLTGEKKYREAQELHSKVSYTKTAHGVPYQPVGNLNIHFDNVSEYSDYYRELDLSKASVITKFRSNGIEYKREMFTSFNDDVLVVRLSSNKRKALNFSVSFNSEQEHRVCFENDELVLTAKNPDWAGIEGKLRVNVRLKVINSGGGQSSTDSTLSITGADEAILYLSSATNYLNYKDISGDEIAMAKEKLQRASSKSFEELWKKHNEKYRSQFNRLELDLGTTESVNLPTDVRIKQFSQVYDPQMVALYFQFGRYLLISSSQPGTQPANLQGIWNPFVNPPWGSKYTVNINTEMNYWPSEVCNLSELQQPLFDMVKDISVTGSETAKTMYGANGWVLHHNTDLWRIAGPVDGFWGFSPTCGAWLTMNLFETYLFNGNKKYLEELYPVLKEASVFFLETLWEKPETGELMVSPASSPENTPFDGLFLFEGTTMSTQNVFILFSSTIKAANELRIDREFVSRLEEARQKLPPMKIGKYAQLQEWYEDWDRINDHHRHVSHMLGLYPGNMISPFKTPELFEALKNSLEYRTDISTGWSMGWKVCLWARLLDGNRAMKLLKNQLTPIGENHGQGEHSGGTYPNLFDAHPPFQIDGNFGCTAGIAEMLLQSQDGAVFVLPALPGDLKSGKVRGLKARGGFEINCEWEDGKITKLSVYSVLGGNLRLRVYKGMISGTLEKEMRQAVGENTNPFYSISDIKSPSISEKAKLFGLNINPVEEYDFPTRPGKEYTLVK